MKCAPWSIANFCLIGDAAHTQGYIPGYGLNAGLEDCELMANLIHDKKPEQTWPELFTQFWKQRKPVTDYYSYISDQMMNMLV